MPMTLSNKIDTLDAAKVIDKDLISDAYKNRIDNLTDEDVERLIELADKLFPNRTSPLEIALLF